MNPIIMPLRGKTPSIGKNTFVAPNATIIGDVVIGEGCSIWYGAVLRGDVNSIRLGNNVNVQDGAVIHTTRNVSVSDLGNNVSIGHNAIVHGGIIKDNVLIGMGATILDNAVVESNTIVAANALVLANSHLEPNSIYAGVPAKKVKEMPPDVARERVMYYANGYAEYAQWYMQPDENQSER